MLKRLERIIAIGVILFASAAVWQDVASATAYPDALQSPHYQFVENSVGNSSMTGSSSPSYVLGASVGDVGVGNSTSGNYQVNGGSVTTADPSLTFSVGGGNQNFGAFSPTSTATATATFQVTDYTSYGYVVEVTGDPPSYRNHTLPAMGTDALGGPQSPSTGIEQFGMNVVANTAPKSFGANPDHGQFGFGSAATNYATPNKYRYVDGEIIASAPKSSGTTTYTISYIVNVNSLTPGGDYKSNQVLICIATY